MRNTAAHEARVGMVIESPHRTSGLAEWNRFAAVNDEFVPIHMDDDAARQAGYSGAIGMGRLQWSYVHNMLREWLDGTGRIVTVRLRFRAPALKDAGFVCRGVVLAVRDTDSERLLDLDIAVVDDEGTVLAPGTATVAIPGKP
ncbi:MaoC family dehydratase [Nocardia miyunensis]|uniref:MaoC family dehydratase n=1 Tax=Nocardia miyunensis TaxID=282684 RepID=UPI00082AFC23|nr:MaoC/PaaZ C-terminal domain-containing protein [Nocardia miyunensis]